MVWLRTKSARNAGAGWPGIVAGRAGVAAGAVTGAADDAAAGAGFGGSGWRPRVALSDSSCRGLAPLDWAVSGAAATATAAIRERTGRVTRRRGIGPGARKSLAL